MPGAAYARSRHAGAAYWGGVTSPLSSLASCPPLLRLLSINLHSLHIPFTSYRIDDPIPEFGIVSLEKE